MNTRNINVDSFSADIEQSELIQTPPEDLEELVLKYQNTLSDILDKHAPLKEKAIKLRPNAPWYNDATRAAKQERRKAERKYKKTKLTVHRDILKEKQAIANNLCYQAKVDYYNKKISDEKENSKELFKIANTLLHKEKLEALPSHSSETELADKFGSYFKQKIETIRKDFEVEGNGAEIATCINSVNSMNAFNELSEEDISNSITKGNSKSCSLDPIPTTLLKGCLPVLLPTIHTIVNKSLQQKTMPTSLKQAVVKPLLKKSTLDKENLKNYRPVSNLPYIGKLIEKVAIKQMDEHLVTEDLHEPLQSAYTANHSTETALLKVTNDILLSLDERKCVLLVLLDISAAFDTIDHNVFLARLTNEYGITGDVRDWMGSYLRSRQQVISINSSVSDKIVLDFGFPQGSCIGPFGFKLYTKPLTEIAAKHNVHIHLYADDTQL